MAPDDEKNPFEDVFDQISDLLRFVQDNIDKPVDNREVPKSIQDRLNRLEKNVEMFCTMGNEIVNETGISREDLEKRLDPESRDIPPETKELIARANQLKQALEEKSKSFAQAIALAKARGDKLTSKKEGKKGRFGKKRSKKFKRFGSDEKWIPL